MTDPKPVHEETWMHDANLILLCEQDPTYGEVADKVILSAHGDFSANSPRAQLAAAAPDLARALLDAEWSAGGGYEYYACPSCGAAKMTYAQPDSAWGVR